MQLPVGFPERELQVGSFIFEINRIGEKFRLPHNLYNSSFFGVGHYALANHWLLPPQNWELQTDIKDNERELPIRWVAIRAYGPLDGEEAKAAILALNNALKRCLPEAHVAERRVHDNGEKRLAEVAKMLERKANKGKGCKQYTPGSYLDIVSKKPTITPKKLRQLERVHPGGIAHASRASDQERKMRERFDTLAVDLFGYGLIPLQHKRETKKTPDTKELH